MDITTMGGDDRLVSLDARSRRLEHQVERLLVLVEENDDLRMALRSCRAVVDATLKDSGELY